MEVKGNNCFCTTKISKKNNTKLSSLVTKKKKFAFTELKLYPNQFNNTSTTIKKKKKSIDGDSGSFTKLGNENIYHCHADLFFFLTLTVKFFAECIIPSFSSLEINTSISCNVLSLLVKRAWSCHLFLSYYWFSIVNLLSQSKILVVYFPNVIH